MRSTEAEAMRSIVGRLKGLLDQEPSLKGQALEKALSEKERLISELQAQLEKSEQGVEGLHEQLAGLAFANGLTLKLSAQRIQLARLVSPQPAKPASAPRLDILS